MVDALFGGHGLHAHFFLSPLLLQFFKEFHVIPLPLPRLRYRPAGLLLR
jgi:hypothetical protein